MLAALAIDHLEKLVSERLFALYPGGGNDGRAGRFSSEPRAVVDEPSTSLGEGGGHEGHLQSLS